MNTIQEKKYLERHKWEYEESKKRIDAMDRNIELCLDIKYELLNKRMPGYKYNYTLDEEVQNNASNHMYV